MKYFVFDYKNASNLGKLYFLPKIHKKLSNVPDPSDLIVAALPRKLPNF